MITSNTKNNHVFYVLVSYLLVFLFGFSVINRLSVLFYIFLTILWVLFLLLGYLVLFKNKSTNFSVYLLIVGVFIGIILNVTSTFTLSDDIYRYLFDGFLVQHHINPYLFAPTDSAISTVARTFPYLHKINNPSVASPYPPLMITISFVFVSLFGYNLLVWLFFINLLWVVTGFILIKMLKFVEISPNYILLWLNPLVLLAFDSSGHNDMIALFLLTLSIYFMVKSKQSSNIFLIISGMLLALSIGIKLFPLFFVPFLIKKLKLGALLTIFFTGIQAFIYLSLINIQTSGLTIFLEHWRGNGGLFELIYFLLNNFNSQNYNQPLQYAIRIGFFTLFSGLFVFLIIIHYRNSPPTGDKTNWYLVAFEFIGYGFIGLFIFSPILHPWYLLWAIIPFIITFDSKFYPYWLLIIINSYSYFLYLNPSYFPYYIIVEYTLFYGALLFYFKKQIQGFKFKEIYDGFQKQRIKQLSK